MRRLRAQIVGFLTLIVPDYVSVPMCVCVLYGSLKGHTVLTPKEAAIPTQPRTNTNVLCASNFTVKIAPT